MSNTAGRSCCGRVGISGPLPVPLCSFRGTARLWWGPRGGTGPRQGPRSSPWRGYGVWAERWLLPSCRARARGSVVKPRRGKCVSGGCTRRKARLKLDETEGQTCSSSFQRCPDAIPSWTSLFSPQGGRTSRRDCQRQPVGQPLNSDVLGHRQAFPAGPLPEFWFSR